MDLMIFLILTMTDTWMQSREMLEDAGLDPDEFDFSKIILVMLIAEAGEIVSAIMFFVKWIKQNRCL